MEAFCRENSIRLLKMASMEGFCSLLKIVQMMDRSNPYSVDTSNTDATDLMIIKNNVNDCKQDENFRSCYDALVSTRSGPTEETEEAVVTYGSRGSVVPVLPPLFPTFFDTTMWSTDVNGR
ncbi:hypothetical protein RvY_04118-2 [Ramazzottius varieornatus]|nr:hypothetical protein RvY_04118-2 [Ramazzottius varieornatus]